MYGTNAFQVVLDSDKMAQFKKDAGPEEKAAETAKARADADWDGFQARTLDVGSAKCRPSALAVQNNVDTIRKTDMGEDDDDYDPFAEC